MNFERLKGTASQVEKTVNNPQEATIALPQNRRYLFKSQWWISLITLPLLGSVMPAWAQDSPQLNALDSRGIISLAQWGISGGENHGFGTPVSARGEDDDKCIWLGVCN